MSDRGLNLSTASWSDWALIATEEDCDRVFGVGSYWAGRAREWLGKYGPVHVPEPDGNNWLDIVEAVLRRQRDGKHAGDRFAERGADFHFNKGDSHMSRMGPDCDGVDKDTGAPHGLLVAIRMFMVDVCTERTTGAQRAKSKESE